MVGHMNILVLTLLTAFMFTEKVEIWMTAIFVVFRIKERV